MGHHSGKSSWPIGGGHGKPQPTPWLHAYRPAGRPRRPGTAAAPTTRQTKLTDKLAGELTGEPADGGMTIDLYVAFLHRYFSSLLSLTTFTSSFLCFFPFFFLFFPISKGQVSSADFQGGTLAGVDEDDSWS